MAKLLGSLSDCACDGWTGEIKHRAFPTRQQQLAATGSLEENMLPLLRY